MPRSSPSSASPTRSSLQRTRFTIVLVGVSVVIVLVAALTSGSGTSADTLWLIGLGDLYGFFAVGFLYATLLISPLAAVFPRLPGKATWFLARRGLGLSSLLFAIAHAVVSFSGPLGGFSGIPFLDPYTGWAVVLGTLALGILLVLGATASDGVARALGPRLWKGIHRTVYVAGLATLVHVFLVGNHYGDLHSPWTFWSLVAVAFLLFLEALRVDQWWAKKFPKDRRYGPATLLVVVLITSAWFWTSGHEHEPSSGVRWVSGHQGVPSSPLPGPQAKP